MLDVWATWCGPCKAMIPHEREMVERLKDKPFQLVSLSIDDEVKTLKEFLAKEKMPWTHWWAGPGGWEAKFADDWDIRSIPAIFVLDRQGRDPPQGHSRRGAGKGGECIARGKIRGGCGGGVESMRVVPNARDRRGSPTSPECPIGGLRRTLAGLESSENVVWPAASWTRRSSCGPWPRRRPRATGPGPRFLVKIKRTP